MKLVDIVKHYKNEGYSALMAESKACQDVMLRNIAKSGYKDKVAVKGGVAGCRACPRHGFSHRLPSTSLGNNGRKRY